MIVLALWMGAILLVATIESSYMIDECVTATLDDIEVRKGPLMAYIAAHLMLEGREWWEV